jgi:hypothetical protein
LRPLTISWKCGSAIRSPIFFIFSVGSFFSPSVVQSLVWVDQARSLLPVPKSTKPPAFPAAAGVQNSFRRLAGGASPTSRRQTASAGWTRPSRGRRDELHRERKGGWS